METLIREHDFSDRDIELIVGLGDDLHRQFGDIGPELSSSDTRMKLSLEALERLDGARLDVGDEISAALDSLEEEAIAHTLDLRGAIMVDGGDLAREMIHGRVALLALAHSIGRNDTNPYESGGDPVSVIAPTGAVDSVAYDSRRELLGHQEVGQVPHPEDPTRLSDLLMYRAVALQGVVGPEGYECPTLLTPIESLLEGLSDDELAILMRGENFGFRMFDALRQQSGSDAEPELFRYNPIILDEGGRLVGNSLDLDDGVPTGDNKDEAQRVLNKLRRAAEECSIGMDPASGKIVIVNNRRALHGRPALPPARDGKIDRVLQRVQILPR